MRLTELTHADYARLGGLESAEVIMWLVMRGDWANLKRLAAETSKSQPEITVHVFGKLWL